MFEKTLNEMTSSVWIDEREKGVLDKNGFFDLECGWNELTYIKAVDLIEHYYKSRPSVSKYEIKRFDSVFHGIMNSFGPEFISLHAKQYREV